MLTIGTTLLLRAATMFDVAATKLLVANKARLDCRTCRASRPVIAAGGLRLGRV
jgi:hypothetical protein